MSKSKIFPPEAALLLTFEDAGVLLACGALKVRRLVDEGVIPRVKIGSLARVARADIEAFVDAQRHRVPDLPPSPPLPPGKRGRGRPKKAGIKAGIRLKELGQIDIEELIDVAVAAGGAGQSK